jgi:hypothetical protein
MPNFSENMIMRHFKPTDNTEYEGFYIYHCPTKLENLDAQYVDNKTISFLHRGQRYNISEVDKLVFKMSNVDLTINDNIVKNTAGVYFSTILDGIATILVEDDHYSVYQGKTIIIPIANLLANDTDVISNGLNPLSLTGISNFVGGTAVINGANIEFTNTSGEVNDIVSFDYEATNLDGHTATGTVNITIDAIPPIICNPDTFDLQQGETLLLSKSALSANDVDGLGKALTVTAVQNPVNGQVTLNGDNVSFTSTGISGVPAEFDYVVTNGSETQTGKVYINVTPLPPIEALIYANSSEVQNALASGYTPPSVQDIFNTWARFDGGSYYVNKDSASGQALDWQLLSNPDRVLMPTNTGLGNGFISPDVFDNYTFEATLFSDSSDNDQIGLIIAFERDNGVNKILAAIRNTGGQDPKNGWGLIYSENGPWVPTWTINNMSVGGATGGWSSKKTRVKIQRQGDIIKAYTTNWNDEGNYQVSSEIVLDLNSDPRLAVFKGKKPYGYYTHSQPNSTYLDVNFTGGMDASKIYDVENNVLWEYQNGQWVNTGTTIQEDLGYVRDATNPETGITYTIKGDEVIVKP